MVSALLRLVGFDLSLQLARLRAQAEDFKNRATHQVKEEVKQTGITVGLMTAGGILLFLTFLVGLAALFLWVDLQHGPFIALGVVALVTAIIAGALFTIAAARQRRPQKPRAYVSPPPSEPAHARPVYATMTPPPANASFVDTLAHHVTHRAAAATEETVDAAAEIVRSGSREAVLATLAVAALVGLVIGRQGLPRKGP
jgi:hypothetical protein